MPGNHLIPHFLDLCLLFSLLLHIFDNNTKWKYTYPTLELSLYPICKVAPAFVIWLSSYITKFFEYLLFPICFSVILPWQNWDPRQTETSHLFCSCIYPICSVSLLGSCRQIFKGCAPQDFYPLVIKSKLI